MCVSLFLDARLTASADLTDDRSSSLAFFMSNLHTPSPVVGCSEGVVPSCPPSLPIPNITWAASLVRSADTVEHNASTVASAVTVKDRMLVCQYLCE